MERERERERERDIGVILIHYEVKVTISSFDTYRFVQSNLEWT